MKHMSFNSEIPKRDFGYSLQLTNYILDSGATCQMTQAILDIIPGSLVKQINIKIDEGYFITAKQTGEV